MRKQSAVRHPMSVAASLILLLLSTSSLAKAGDSINRAKLDFARENNIPLELLFMDREALTDAMRQRLALQYGVPLEFFAPDPAKGEAAFLSTAQQRFAIIPPAITVSSLFPTSGGVSGGTRIFINGFDFAPGATVMVGGVAATDVTVNDCRFIFATTPAHAAGTVDVAVTNPDAQFATRVGGFTYVPDVTALTVTEVRPNSGPVSGGTYVTITGSGFQTTGIFVFFGSYSATDVQVINSTTLTAVTPLGVEGLASALVSQSGSASASLADGFLYTGMNPPAPTITSLDPAVAVAPGNNLKIIGLNLANFEEFLAVRFNDPGGFGAFASVVSQSATEIIARVPAGAITGPVTVETTYGTARSCPFLTVMTAGPPTITGVPATAEEGSFITITGTNFADVREVKFGSMPASFFFVSSATSIGASPSVGALSGPISVVTSAGTATSSSVSVTPLSVFCTGAAPTITGFTPTSGAPRAAVTLTGTGFKGFSITPGQGFTRVVFPGAPAVFVFSPTSTTQLVVSVPPGAVSGPIRVITDYGSATSTASFMVTSQPLPVVTSLSPDRGNAGTSVTMVSGVGGLEGVTEVRFGGGLLTTNFFFSAGSLIVTVPPGAITGPISLTSPSGTASSAIPFTVVCEPPTITSFTPVMGPDGTSVTINGTNFIFGFSGELAVTFNRIAASFPSVSSNGNSMTANVPAAATTGRITVRTVYGTATSAADFTVTTATPPAITGFTPGSGAPGTSVIITGSDFHGATMVTFNGIDAGAFAVSNGITSHGKTIQPNPPPVAGRPFGPFSNGTTIRATVPPGATSGPVSVVTPRGTATSPTNFTVTSSAPTITGSVPRGGLPGTKVTIAGTNFTGATAVTFNGVAATFTVFTSTVITATVPTGATDGPIAVTTANGTATSATSFAVQAGPTVTGVQPSSGPRAGGTAVTITGTGFQAGATVLFGGVAASNVTVVNATTITATTPPGHSSGSSGQVVSVTVTNPDGQSAALTSAFTYSDLPKGDGNGDGAVTVGDIFYLINHLFAGGPPAIGSADVNADGQVTVGDIFYLINFLFAGGPPPL